MTNQELFEKAVAGNWIAETFERPTVGGGIGKFYLKGTSKGYATFGDTVNDGDVVFYAAFDDDCNRESGFGVFNADDQSITPVESNATLANGKYIDGDVQPIPFPKGGTITGTFNAVAFNAIWKHVWDRNNPHEVVADQVEQDNNNDLGDNVQDALDNLSGIIAEWDAAIKATCQNYVSELPPANPDKGDMWTDVGVSGEQYVWEGDYWVSVTGGGLGVNLDDPDSLPSNIVRDEVGDEIELLDKPLNRVISSYDGSGKWVEATGGGGGDGLWTSKQEDNKTNVTLSDIPNSISRNFIISYDNDQWQRCSLDVGQLTTDQIWAGDIYLDARLNGEAKLTAKDVETETFKAVNVASVASETLEQVVLGGINVTGLDQDAPFTEAEMADARSIQNAFTVTHSSKGVTVEIDKEGTIRAKEFTDLDGNPVGGGGDPEWADVSEQYGRVSFGYGNEIDPVWTQNAVIIGTNIKAGSHSVMIGADTQVIESIPGMAPGGVVAVGTYAKAADEGVAVGGGATVTGYRGIALGEEATAGEKEFGIGFSIETVNFSKATVQAKDYLDADGNSIIGAGGGGDPEWAEVDIEKSSTALGWYAEAGQNSTAVGFNAVAGSSNCVALGRGIDNLQYSSIGIGSNVDRVGGQSIAIGSAVDNIADNCVVIGSGVARVADNSIAIGSNITAESDKSIAIGSNITTNSECPDAISIGHGVSINDRSRYAIAIGTEAEVEDESDYSIALGYQANAEESEFAISPYIQNVDFARANIKAKDYLDIDGKRATVSPALIAEAFTTLQAAVADEDTVEGIKTALTNALGGLIEKFEGIHNA
jgi:hypothetical protein